MLYSRAWKQVQQAQPPAFNSPLSAKAPPTICRPPRRRPSLHISELPRTTTISPVQPLSPAPSGYTERAYHLVPPCSLEGNLGRPADRLPPSSTIEKRNLEQAGSGRTVPRVDGEARVEEGTGLRERVAQKLAEGEHELGGRHLVHPPKDLALALRTLLPEPDHVFGLVPREHLCHHAAECPHIDLGSEVCVVLRQPQQLRSPMARGASDIAGRDIRPRLIRRLLNRLPEIRELHGVSVVRDEDVERLDVLVNHSSLVHVVKAPCQLHRVLAHDLQRHDRPAHRALAGPPAETRFPAVNQAAEVPFSAVLQKHKLGGPLPALHPIAPHNVRVL
mmetsp:Transcript_14660/g.29366  ORF Transcript_14660/g.29366 Transcript_14660/m.29366 type:complete len:333 (-) Transcript_14660:449-1447(-)